METITKEQFEQLTERMTNRHKLACYLMYYCGLRVGELSRCRVLGEVIEVETEKRRSKVKVFRQVPIPSKVKLLLEQGVEPPTNRIRVFEAVKNRGRQIGLPDIHPHTLRHSYATNMLNAGLTVADVQYLLGHARIASTQVYLHPDLQMITERLQRSGML